MKECRTCLLKLENDSGKDIFQTKINQEFLSTILAKMANVVILDNDGLPQTICPDCWQKLHEMYFFRALIIESDAKLHQRYPMKALQQEDIHDSKDKKNANSIMIDENQTEGNSEVDDNDSKSELCKNDGSPKRKPRTRKRSHVCQECGKAFARAAELSKHSISHTDDKPDSDGLEIEVDCVLDNNDDDDDDEDFKLDSCQNNASFKPKRKKQTHVCQECGKVFKRAAELKKHGKSHAGEKPETEGLDIEVDCRLDETDSKADAPKNDKPPKPLVKKRSHECQECGKGFPRAAELRRHNKSHTGEKPFQCDMCGKRFGSKQSLGNHKEKHFGEYTFNCETCGKCYKSISGLIYHQRLHQNIRNHKCEVCNKAFIHKSILEVHKKTHSQERDFVCEYCSKTFKHKENLTFHQKNTHFKQIKIDNCPICGKLFVHKYLKRHVMRHSGEKSFECTICHDKFTERGSLRNHTMRVHEGKKPFECEVCGKKFPIKYECYLHMRVHTKEKPFPCPMCDKAFAYKHHLRNHLSKGHLTENV